MTLADDVEAFVVILYILAAIGALCVVCFLGFAAVVAVDLAREARMGSRAVDAELREMTGDGPVTGR